MRFNSVDEALWSTEIWLWIASFFDGISLPFNTVDEVFMVTARFSLTIILRIVQL